MATNERLAAVVLLVTAGSALSLAIAPPLAWVFVALLLVTTCVGTDQVLRGHPNAASTEHGVSVYVLPALLVLGSFLFLRLPAFDHGLAAVGELVVAGLVLAITLSAEYQTLDRAGARARQARLILNLIAYLTAFALFSAIFAPKVRSLLSATAVLVASALIAAELLRGSGRAAAHPRWILVVALTLGQVTWALNYWVLGAYAGGAILLLVFYTVTGLVRSHLTGTLARSVLTEHLVVAGAGLAAVVAGGLWLR